MIRCTHLVRVTAYLYLAHLPSCGLIVITSFDNWLFAARHFELCFAALAIGTG